jgi:hypothetical protein
MGQILKFQHRLHEPLLDAKKQNELITSQAGPERVKARLIPREDAEHASKSKEVQNLNLVFRIQ